MDFDKQTKDYRLFEPTKQQILISRDTACGETKLGFQHNTARAAEEHEYTEIQNTEKQHVVERQPNQLPTKENGGSKTQSVSNRQLDQSSTEETGARHQDFKTGHKLELDNRIETEPSHHVEIKRDNGSGIDDTRSQQRYPTRERQPNRKLKDYFTTMSAENKIEPQSFEQAIE